MGSEAVTAPARGRPASATPSSWRRVAPAWLARLLLVAPLGLLVWVVLPAVVGWHPTNVMTGSMEPRIQPGDVVVARPVETGNLQIGQVLLVTDPDHQGRLRLHRLEDITDTGHLVLKGDANAQADSTPVDPAAVHGVAALRIPWVARPLVWVADGYWWALIVAAGALALLVRVALLDRGPRHPRAVADAPTADPLRTTAILPIVPPQPLSARPVTWEQWMGRPPVEPSSSRPAGRGPRWWNRRRPPAVNVLLVGALAVLPASLPLLADHASATWAAGTSATPNNWAAARYLTCDDSVLANGAAEYYRLDDSGPPNAANSVSPGAPGTYQGTAANGVTFGVAGPCSPAGGAVTLDGSNGWVSTAVAVANPQVYSSALWFRTTSGNGGLLTGFVADQTGGGSQMDRITYMDTSGRLVFGTYPGSVHTITSEGQFNDGQWHHVVATESADGKFLYVDGVVQASSSDTQSEAFTGYWRIGYAAFSTNWASGTAEHFAGSVASAAFYNRALGPSEVAAQYAAAAPAGGCASAVASASPFEYYPLDEGGPSIARDASPAQRPGAYHGGVTYNVPGPCPGRSAVTLDGSTGYVSTSTAQNNPTTYSVSLWFRTTTTRGGLLIDFADPSAGTPTTSDRMVYMDNSGHLVFGTHSGQYTTLTSPAGYNNGAWHQVTASQSGQGMRLSVDGVLVAANTVTTSQNFTGYWRIGGGNFDSWPVKPSSRFFAGSVAQAAVFPTALSPAQVSSLYTAATIPPSCSAAVLAARPSLYYRLNQVSGATVAVDYSGNGRNATYQTPAMFTFGAAGPCQRDGSTGVTLTGPTPTVAEPTAEVNPVVFTVAAWVRTTSTQGGRVVGFSDQPTGLSANYDRHLFLTDDGRIVFGVKGDGELAELVSSRSYNDGRWHHLVGTESATGTALWVDGVRVATSTVTSGENRSGYWRIGWDNLDYWPSRPSSLTLDGSLADVAVYPTVLTPQQISSQYQARSGP